MSMYHVYAVPTENRRARSPEIMLMNCHLWVLGTKPVFSGRALSALTTKTSLWQSDKLARSSKTDSSGIFNMQILTSHFCHICKLTVKCIKSLIF